MAKIITDFRNKINYLGFFLFISCAAIMSPPGGDKDETPPELLSTVPKNKTTNYNGNQIELLFSEYIDEKRSFVLVDLLMTKIKTKVLNKDIEAII